MCALEVDAVSFGQETLLSLQPGDVKFSVDALAEGRPLPAGVPYSCVPTLYTQGVFGAGEAQADVFGDALGFNGMTLPMGPPGFDTGFSDRGNVGVLDGDGARNSTGHQYWGIGLVEGGSPSGRDTLDALELDSYDPQFPVYYSLDGGIIDPLQPGVLWQDSASVHFVSPAAILNSGPGGVSVFVAPQVLGLDITGLGTDDIDALAMNVVNDVPNWILFSVRRGSAVIGQTDTRWGAPIEPGDILEPPAAPGLRPQIFIPAEALGLATARTHGLAVGDELDALTIFGDELKAVDCNANGREDAAEIAGGAQQDCNANGVPDVCEPDSDGDGIIDGCDDVGTAYCFAVGGAGGCPCSGPLPGVGCANSTGSGGALSATGSRFLVNQSCLPSSSSSPTHRLVLRASGLPPGQSCLFFQADNQVQGGAGTQFGDGLRCAGGNVIRLETLTANSSGVAETTVDVSSVGGVSSGQTKYYQGHYRDNASPCGTGFNLTNGLGITWL